MQVLYFVHEFGLDFKVEHLAIRNSMRARHRNMKKASRKLDKICLRLHQKVMKTHDRQCTRQERIIARKEYAEAIEKFNKAEDARYELYRDLVNFRYFLVRFISIHDESVDDVCDAMNSLREVEYERMWRNDGTGILDYWGDEDPDA
jgi:exonuclease VII large subunit